MKKASARTPASTSSNASTGRVDPALISVWLLGVAPIMLMPGLMDRWGWPVLLTVILAGVFAAASPPSGRLPTWMTAATIGGLAVLMVAALSGQAPLAQLLGRAPRYEGSITWTVLLLAVWSAARVMGPGTSPPRIRAFADAVSLAGVLLGGVALLEAIGLTPIETDVSRPGSLAGNATDQGLIGVMICAILTSILLGVVRRGGTIRRWHVAGAIFSVATVLTAASRAAFIALAVSGVIIAFSHFRNSIHRARDARILAGALLAVGATVFVIPATRERFFSGDPLASQTVGDRFVIWKATLNLVRDNLWFGVGPNGYADSITRYLPDDWFGRAEIGSVLDSPHNILLQIAVTSGIVGIALALGIFAVVCLAAVRSMKSASVQATTAREDILLGAFAGVLGLVAGLLTHVTSPKTMVLAAVCVGIMVAQPPRLTHTEVKAPIRVRRYALAAGFGVWFVVMAAWTAADSFILSGVRNAAVGNTATAQQQFERAASLRPWDADIPLRAAESMGGLADGGVSEAGSLAAEWASEAVRRLPGSSRAHQARGMIALGQGDMELATSELLVAAELFPADPRLHHEAGMALAVAGRLDAARGQLERAGELAPDSTVTWQLLTQVCEALGDQPCVSNAQRLQEQSHGEDAG